MSSASAIKCFGEYWNAARVDWQRGTPIGEGSASQTDSSAIKVDVAKATAVYCLYDDFRPVYLGQAKNTLFDRLKAHAVTDRLAGRWDSFSFYSLTDYNRTGQLSAPSDPARYLSASQLVGELEALAIRLIDPPLNRRHETFTGARELQQVVSNTPALGIANLETKIDHILTSLRGGRDVGV